jgi:hypothetical protein
LFFFCLPLQYLILVQSAGVGLNVLFADIIDEYVLVRLHHAAPLASLSHYPQVEESDLHDMPACDRPSALTASLTDDYVHIEVEPPEEPLPETDLKRQQHLKLLRQQAAEELERKLLEADERLSALKSALPSPQQEQEEQKLRQVFESIIDQLQETFEGRQILEKPSIQKRRLLPDLSVLDQHQRALMEQQRLLDALMVQVRHLINMDQVLFALEAQRLLLFHTFSGSCQTTREPALGAGAAAT